MGKFLSPTAAEGTSADMKAVVIGTGAIGGMIAGYLSGAGHDILAADGWDEHVRAIQDRGLKVDGVRGNRIFQVRAITFGELRRATGPYEVVFVCVKSYETDQAAEMARPLLGIGSVVVSTQNGLNEERLAELLGADRVVGAVTEVGGSLPEPGVVVETRRDGGFLIGEMNGRRSERIEGLARFMSDCAPTAISDNIVGILWSKLLWNCMLNAGSAVTGLGQGQMIVDDRLRPRLIALGREVAELATATGVRLEPLSFLGVDPGAICSSDPAVAKPAEQRMIQLYQTQLEKATSMLQDVLKGRRTEVDHLNGYVVATASRLGRHAPLNQALVQLVHAIQDGRLRPNPAHLLNAIPLEAGK
jgi:2-dehydropantoate 2-reductase